MNATKRPPEKTPRARLAEPTPAFRDWWQPSGFNRHSGAQTGGHPEALRKCVRIDPYGSKEVRYYGIDTTMAYNIRHYREEYDQWIKDGMMERTEIVDGTAAPIERQKEVFRQINELLDMSVL